MSAIQHCPQCSTAIPPDAPGGVCPKCVLGLGLRSIEPSDAGAFPSAPELPPTSARHRSRFAPRSAAELAHHFPNLEILELIGQGGMGAVYKARQPNLNRVVALKVLPLETAADAAFADRFAREAQTLARLNHPHIVTIYDSGQADGLFYFVMEFVDGANLRQMQRTGRLTPAQALAIVPQICEALQFAHDEGIVHRDIKPENILIDRKGRVKIADFGLAKLLGRQQSDLMLTGTHQVMGTPHYMAPEQMERPLSVDHRADIYSLGVVFYEMLTGELPLGRFQPPSRKVTVDVRLDEVVLHALEKEPQRRYQHASQVKADVDSISSSQVAPAGHEPKPQATAEPFEMEVARHLVKAPSVGLLIAAALPVIFAAVLAAMHLARLATAGPSSPQMPDWVAMMLVAVPAGSLVYGLVVALGALQLRRLRAFELVVLSTIVAALPTLTCGFYFSQRPDADFLAFVLWCGAGVPAAIWVHLVIWRRDVRAAFQQQLTEQIRARQGKSSQSAGAIGKESGKSAGHSEAAAVEPRLVQAPADCLLLAAGIAFVTACGVAAWLGLMASRGHDLTTPLVRAGLTMASVTLATYSLFIGVAGLLLRRLRARLFVLLVVVVVGLFLPAVIALNVVMELPRMPEWPVAIPLWLGVPAALWVVVTLFREDVRRAFEAARAARDVAKLEAEGHGLEELLNPKGERKPGAFSPTAGAVPPAKPGTASEPGWEVWWFEQSPATRKMLKVAMFVFATFCMISFLTTLGQGSGKGSSVRIGIGDPWLKYESGQPIAFDPLTWSFASGVVCVFIVVALWTVIRAELRRAIAAGTQVAGYWSSPWPIVTIVIPLVVLASILVAAVVIPWVVNRFRREDPAAVLSSANDVPPLGTITSGIGVDFTVPAGQVAVFEIVTRRDSVTVPLPPHCAYVMAPADKQLQGTFRWSHTSEAVLPDGRRTWGIEVHTAGSGGGSTGGLLLPAGLDAAVGSRGIGLHLAPNEEVIDWGTADASNLPANGLIGLRVTVVPHGLTRSGSGIAHTDWKTEPPPSTTRRKLTQPATQSQPKPD